MATVFKISTRKVRGIEKFVLDLRSIGKGREFFDDRDSAETRLIEIQSAGISAASLLPSERHEYLDAKLMLAKAGATVRQAAEFFIRHHKAKEQVGLSDAITEFIASKIEKKRREKYTDNLRYDLEAFACFCGPIFCHDCTQQQIEAWLSSKRWEPKTKNGKLINVRTFFSFAARKGWVIDNPALRIERVSVDHATPSILTVEQCERLMRVAKAVAPGMLPYLSLGLFAGIRPAEIFRLSWAKVDVKNGIVRIDGDVAKTRRRRIVHLSDNARAWLKLGGDLPPNQWQDRLIAIRKAAGFDYSVRSKRKGVKSRRMAGEPFGHDSLRHSYVSYSIPINGISETAREAGHSESILHTNYKDLVTKSDARAFWSIMP